MSAYSLQTVAVHSLAKVFPEIGPREEDRLSLRSFMANEPFSFQIAYKFRENTTVAATLHAKIQTELPISLFSVDYVPVLQANLPHLNDKYRAGLFPDRLIEKKVNPKVNVVHFPWEGVYIEDDDVHLAAEVDSWRCIWITVNEKRKKLAPGDYTLKVEFFSQKGGAKVGEEEIALQVIGASLPKQKLKCTNWFHCDCLCDVHGVELFSDRFWDIFADYIKKATLNGMNLLLTPCFTPPLDTPIGKERMTVQLVGITLADGEYHFDFSLLEKYIAVAQANGMEYFEHSHLFTQWGAKAAPKIMATVDGKYKRIFGWNTVAWGKKYTEFLHAYIPALLAFLKSKGLDKKFMFHISDEPTPQNSDGYRKAKGAVGDLLDGYLIGDALQHYEMYEQGLAQTPIVATNHVHEFYGRTKHLWAYYTGEQSYDGMSNRMLSCSGERNRMLGIHLYMHEIEGFLHWGYNFYYDVLSQGVSNPTTDVSCYLGSSQGSSFLVYPTLNGCSASMRQKVFYEGINDMRALQLLESYIGKAATKAFVEEYFGKVTFFTHPGTAENLFTFRKLLNEKIEACAKK